MRLKINYRILQILKVILKYSILFTVCYSFLFINLNFFWIFSFIIIVNFIFIKIELTNHLASQLAKLIKAEKYEEALELGLMRNAGKKDDYSKLLMLTAYYKIGQEEKALNILKSIDNKKWKSKKMIKILNNWKVKILLDNPYQLN